MKKTWTRAKLLALWHGGKPAEYVPMLMKQGDNFKWYNVDLMVDCCFLLAFNLLAVAYLISM